MPKRSDLSSILIIGAGPIIIGQACEFDYSGTQACKALKEEGYKVILVNSNPATIMTDPEFADVTYIEPLTLDILEKIIAKERPSALLPTLGGQTALNLSMELHHAGVLEKYGVEMIGAKPEAIRKGEDRELFKQCMLKIGLDVAKSKTVHTMEEARAAADFIGAFPLIIRPSFTLGGSGGGIAYNREEFEQITAGGLEISPTHEVLVEECLLGWKEYEMEVMRDHKDQCVVICSIENFDPMGVHTGDSITVAPAMTLTDKDFQVMRDASFAVIREIGVATGGSNIQFSIDPQIRNDITRLTPASFEPTIDYVVTKIPRFTFEKFIGANPTLTSSMKSVGEAMAVGRTFKESFQKCLRSLETGARGWGGGGKFGGDELPDDETIRQKLGTPNAERVYFLRHAFRAGYTVEQIFDLTKIDPWFLHQLRELHEMEESLRKFSLKTIDAATLRRAKQFGFSDAQLAHLLKTDFDTMRAHRKAAGVKTTFRLVDTCAAEFEAFTPYYYSSYGDENEVIPSAKPKIMIIGGGPNRIGQGIEFDYCCVHASFALREIGFETVMINSNPETVSTDYDTSDRLYFEPLTLEDVLEVYEQEQCSGAIVQFGGQTPLNLAAGLKAHGVNVIGTTPESIDLAEDRKLFAAVLDELQLKQPPNRTALNEPEALAFAHEIGFPVLLRPSFVLGGRGMFIVYSEDEFKAVIRQAFEVMPGKPVLIDKFLEDAIELDVDCLSDGETSVIGGMLEHIEFAGVHSGDAAMVMPPHTLSAEMRATVRTATYALAQALKVIGLMNVQFAVKGNQLYVLEVNPRASRTVPFVAKAIGVPLAKLAAKVMAGKKLADLGFTRELQPKHWCVKEAVFPFARFPGAAIVLGPEMRSTGEVMGLDDDLGLAFAKTQMAAKPALPAKGNVFLSVKDADKPAAVALAQDLLALGFSVCSTGGTARFLAEHGVTVKHVNKLSEGRPNAVDLIKNGQLQMIINTPSGMNPRRDENLIRAAAYANSVCIMTTIMGATAALMGIRALQQHRIGVRPLQEYRHNTVAAT
ncbi:MAG: carbamoyl-phosphate synthase large subunit [Opitutae bacterium]|nr:carbamoyl-phosphate synthase large subunit [Opitutae bacterium]